MAAVSDGVSLALYLNGQRVAEETWSGDATYLLPAPPPVQPNTFSLLLGAFQRNGAKEFFFNGLLDEMTIYNRAVTAVEVEGIYAARSAGKCRPPEVP